MARADERDVIVVGAGPAGSAAAARLAQLGHDVLLLDKNDFPRDKPCGDGIPPGTIEILNGLGMADALRAAGFYSVHRIILGSPWGRTWETAFDPKRPGGRFVIARRRAFDALIQSHAVVCGAEFQRANVTSVLREGSRVVGVRAATDGNSREIRSRIVIGADGATSIVGREMRRGKQRLRDRAVAIRAYAEGLQTLPHTVEFYFERWCRPGYAWVFPLGADTANVGVIMRSDRYRDCGDNLHGLLERFLASDRVRARRTSGWELRNVASWQLACASGPTGPRVFDGALLVGDAGRWVDALTGEGIHNALVSSQVAAAVAHEAIAAGDVSAASLGAYDTRCEAALGRLVRRAARAQHWIADHPAVLEMLFILANASDRRIRAYLNRVSTDFVIHA